MTIIGHSGTSCAVGRGRPVLPRGGAAVADLGSECGAIVQRKKRTGGVAAAAQGRPRRSKLDVVSGWLRARVDAEPDITMPELSDASAATCGMRATPAVLSRQLIHHLGYTYKKISDCD
jgi:transposase